MDIQNAGNTDNYFADPTKSFCKMLDAFEEVIWSILQIRTEGMDVSVYGINEIALRFFAKFFDIDRKRQLVATVANCLSFSQEIKRDWQIFLNEYLKKKTCGGSLSEA